jgi:two-component system KDP operon response regulator KdpE
VSIRSRILVIDDDAALGRRLTSALKADGFAISQAASGAAALDVTEQNRADVVLLELGLPDLDGLDVIRLVRGSGSAVPIIVLSNRTDENSKVQAFDFGADDYVTKPFGIEELRARIRAVLRNRLQSLTRPTILEAGTLRMDLDRSSVAVRGVEVNLSPREHNLLRLLAINAGKVLTHDYILRNVWGDSSQIQYLRIYIRSIRRKIEIDPERPQILLTEWGIGYRLNEAESA